MTKDAWGLQAKSIHSNLCAFSFHSSFHSHAKLPKLSLNMNCSDTAGMKVININICQLISIPLLCHYKLRFKKQLLLLHFSLLCSSRKVFLVFLASLTLLEEKNEREFWILNAMTKSPFILAWPVAEIWIPMNQPMLIIHEWVAKIECLW